VGNRFGASHARLAEIIPFAARHYTVTDALGRSASFTMGGSGLNQWQEWKSMASKKKILAKRQPWNKGLKVGQSDGLAPDQVKRIRGVLADLGVPGLRDLALFSTAIDTMLPGQDLLNLAVGDAREGNATGAMRLVQIIHKGAWKMDQRVR
jgi:hypothetical protein